MERRLPRSVVPVACLALLGAASASPGGLEEPEAVAASPVLDGSDAVLSWIGAHPGRAAFAVFSLEGGEPRTGAGGIDHRADELMPLASTSKMVLLTAYAREVAEGRVDPAETVAAREWDRYHLPRTDVGAHAASLRELGLRFDAEGFATEEAAVPLDGIVHCMIRLSDNAAADYLMHRLGAAVADVQVEAGFLRSDPLQPYLGQFLFWQNHERTNLDGPRVSLLLDTDRRRAALEAEQLAERYRSGPWRKAELEWRGNLRLDLEDVRGQAKLTAQFAPRGTVRDYARLISGIASRRFPSADAAAVAARHLEWTVEPGGTDEQFEVLATKSGSLPGVVTRAGYFVPNSGDFAGETRVVVLFLERLSIESWGSLIQSRADLDFCFRLARESTFVESLRGALP